MRGSDVFPTSHTRWLEFSVCLFSILYYPWQSMYIKFTLLSLAVHVYQVYSTIPGSPCILSLLWYQESMGLYK